jgi:hypothetical protein
MKKFIVAILAFLYISTSVGATVNLHYCMGKLQDWGFGHKESKTCDKCGMEKSAKKDNGCCKDENKFVKNDTDQKTAESAFQMFQVIAVALPVSFYEIPSAHIPSVTEENPQTHAPPQSNGVAVYIRNCVFRI